MIAESSHWKEPLGRDADIIERWALKPDSERRYAILERKIMIAAFAIRRLVQSEKLSSAFAERSIVVHRCKVKRQRFSSDKRLDIDDNYDLGSMTKRTFSVMALLDQIIHSFVFLLASDGEVDAITGFFVVSDRDRYKELLLIDLLDFLKLMRVASADYPSSSHRVRDQQTGDWVSWAGHSEPPEHVMRMLDKARKTRPP